MKLLLVLPLVAFLVAQPSTAQDKEVEEVKSGIDGARKVLKFASRNLKDEKAATESVQTSTTSKINDEVETKKTYAIRNADEPWLTNPAYVDDPYSNQHATAKANHDEQLDKLVLECIIEKGKNAKPEHQQYWKDKCKQNAIYKLPKLDMPKRGTLDYVKQEYLPIKELSKSRFGRALKGKLVELDDVRKKTRLVGGLMSTNIEEAELTYEQVNYEICHIEKLVGRISGTEFCHR